MLDADHSGAKQMKKKVPDIPPDIQTKLKTHKVILWPGMEDDDHTVSRMRQYTLINKSLTHFENYYKSNYWNSSSVFASL